MLNNNIPEVSDNNERFICPMCGSIFDTQQALDRHKQEDHNEPNSPPARYR
jgi:uncharacterized C2H2 Zn-finger protein